MGFAPKGKAIRGSGGSDARELRSDGRREYVPRAFSRVGRPRKRTEEPILHKTTARAFRFEVVGPTRLRGAGRVTAVGPDGS